MNTPNRLNFTRGAATLLLTYFFAAFALRNLASSQPINGSAPVTVEEYQNDTRGRVPGDAINGIEDLSRLSKVFATYRSRHEGKYPSTSSDFDEEVKQSPKEYGFATAYEAMSFQLNPDSRYADNIVARRMPEKVIPYIMLFQRPDGNLNDAPKMPITRGLLAMTDLYYHRNFRIIPGLTHSVLNPVGFYLALWDDGKVEKVPYDLALRAYKGEKRYQIAFTGQAGVSWNCVTYDEQYTQMPGPFQVPPRGKPVPEGETLPIPDNGGPEALIAFSRLLDQPLEREKMWEHLDIKKSVFSLADIQQGAAKLGVTLQNQTLPFDQLQKGGRSAILQLREPDRVITLSTAGEENSVIYDGGMMRIVDNATLTQRYSGQALVIDQAASNSALQIGNPVREVEASDFTAEIPQSIPLTNRGNAPLNLQIERPTCGATSAGLSQSTLAPGETATLNVSLKWRTVLTGGVQNVLVTLKTNNPIQPRVQLGFKMRMQQTNEL